MITDSLVTVLSGVPPWLATIILATLPVGELRGALPVALTVYDLPLTEAFILSVLGNLLPVYFLLVFFERAASWASRHSPRADRFLQWLYQRTRRKLHDKVAKYGVWALALFVAIPLPVTGAWTGSLAAFVFGLDKKDAFIAIAAGLVISATIVTLITLGASFTVNSFIG